MTPDARTVLIVDDDAGIRQILGTLVARLGYHVRLADSAEAALQVLEAETIDVAVCDVRMPGADGIWLVDRIRERHPDVPAILATGVREMDPCFTLRPGVVAYVVKPFDRQELLLAIKTGMAWRDSQVATSGRFFVTVDPQLPC